MNMKKTILSGLLFLGLFSTQAQAQQEPAPGTGEVTGTTEYVFNPHWYVQLQPLGLQYTLGEVDFGDLLSYNLQVGAGYQFSSVFGARLSVNAWQSKAGIDNATWRLAGDQNFKGKWSWKYVAPSLDLTCNLSNLAFGINPNRLFNLSAFLGIGANIGFSNDDAANVKASYADFSGLKGADKDENMDYLWDGTKVRLTGRAGLQGDFRITDKISAGIEVNANLLSDKYNSKKAGNADWYFNALAGVKINLGDAYTTRFIPAPPPVLKYVATVVPDTIEVIPQDPIIEPIRRDIFFLINKYDIRQSEIQKVKEIADYMQKYPNSKVTVTGYADAGTGNDRINDRLAAQRADAVVKALKDQYGISASRISYDSKGARVQPFSENDKNRVSICIAE